MDLDGVRSWVVRYEQAWRTPGTGALSELFADEATYLVSPWAAPIRGLADIARLWNDERTGPGEAFTMSSEVVAVDGDAAVVRVQVDYEDGDSGRWRDLWVLQFDDRGRCRAFEEWPFAPDQLDGHGRSES